MTCQLPAELDPRIVRLYREHVAQRIAAVRRARREAQAARRLLSEAFVIHAPVEVLYVFWQHWKTAERLLWLLETRTTPPRIP